MNPVSPRDDPAFPVMTLNILTSILGKADNPGDMGRHLTEQIRELTGARCVVIIQCPSTAGKTAHRVVGVNPPRRRRWSESPAACQLYEMLHDPPSAQIWRDEEHPETAKLLQPEGFAVSLVVPLHVGPVRVGELLALGLPDDAHLASALTLLATLSTMAALVLRAASLYENQEQAIQERTRDLQASNEMLRKSDEQVRSLLKEAQQARGALLSILEDEKRAQEEVRRVNRALRALSDCNQTVIRAADESELLASVCQVIIDSGGYPMAWIGYAEDDEIKSVRPVAQAGSEAGALETLEITWADADRGQGPAGRAIRTGQLSMARNGDDDPVRALLWGRGIEEGPVCSLGLPLVAGGETFGALSVYSNAAEAFGAEEVALLNEMAGDLAYGIAALRTRSARAQAEAKLLLFRQLIDRSNDSIFVVEPQTGLVLDVNETACRLLGYSREELLNLLVFDFDLAMRDSSQWAAHLQIVQAAGTQTLESTHQRKDGTTFPVEVSVSYTVRDRKDYLIAVVRDTTERKQTQRALQRSNDLLRAVIEAAPTAIIGLNLDGNVDTVWNPAAERMLGWSAHEVMGRPLPTVPAESQGEFRGFCERIRSGMTLNGVEVRRQRRDGTPIDYSVYASPLHDAEGCISGNVAVLVDITERKRADEALRRLNRELRALSCCNQTLLRAEDEPTLLNEICRIICSEAGYRMAWAGYAEHDAAKTIRPVAWAGLESGYIANARLSWADDTEHGCGPAGITIRSGETIWIQDLSTDPCMAPWRESVLERGYRSGIALPLKDGNARVFGVLLIYSSESDLITPDEIRLMEQLAGDLSFGISVLRDRAERKRAEKELRARTEELDHFFSLSLDLLCIADTDGHFARLNPSWERTLGYSLAELQTPRFFDFIHPDDTAPTQEAVATLAAQRGVTDFINRYRCADGSYRWLEWRSAPGGNRIYAVARDITERRKAEEVLLRSEREKTILNQIASVLLTAPDEEVYGDVLAVIRDALRSKYGVFGYIAENGDLAIPSLSGDVWSECEVSDKSIIFPSNSWGASLWGRAIREKRSFVSDGPFHLPTGHVRIDCFLTTPIVFGDRTIGLLSVANREAGYGKDDTALLETITGYLAPILNARLQRDRLEQERKRAEERIVRQLQEKELLVREIHHRVKNNMQVIASLLELQVRQAGDKRLGELLTASRGRIRTMAMVHERLYSTRDMTRVDLRDYIEALVAELLGLYGVDLRQVEVRVDVAHWTLGIATAIPCALIIHELLSNALRHAFPGGRRGRVAVSLVRASGGAAELTVQDDGVGIPEGLDLGTTESLGLHLVYILATDQLRGTVSLERDKGTKALVRFAEAQS